MATATFAEAPGQLTATSSDGNIGEQGIDRAQPSNGRGQDAPETCITEAREGGRRGSISTHTRMVGLWLLGAQRVNCFVRHSHCGSVRLLHPVIQPRRLGR